MAAEPPISEQRSGKHLDYSKLPESPWYELKESMDVAMAAWEVLGYLQDNYNDKRDTIIRNMRLYGGNSVEGYGPYTYNKMPNNPFRASDRLSLNVIASNIDTFVSKMAKDMPRPRFLTTGGNYKQQRRAKRLQEFMDGMYYNLDLRNKSLDQIRDSCVFGTGLLYFYRIGSKIHAERVFPGEVFVDPKQSLYGEPQEYFRVKYVDRAVLLGMYKDSPEAQYIIAHTDPVEDPSYTTSTYQFQRDQIQVVMAWHLESAPDADDGRFVTCVQEGCLQDLPYKRQSPPFSKMLWKKPMVGYWGKGIADDLTGLQIEINKLLKKIQDAHHLLAVPWVLRPVGSRVNPAQIQNVPALILDYNGEIPPTVVSHRTVNPEIYEHLQRLINYSYEITGISQLSATSEKPAGLNSGVALQEFHDIGTERFQDQGRRREDVVAIEYSEHIIYLAKEISEDGGCPDCIVNAPVGQDMQKIKWSDVEIPRDDILIQVYPTSSFPKTPAAKQERVMQMMGGQLIDPAEALQLLDFPDLKAFTERRDAPLEDIQAVIGNLEEGKYETPEPFSDFVRARPMIQGAYLRARRQGAPEKALQAFRRYMVELDALQQRTAAYQAQQSQLQQMAMQAQAGLVPGGGQGAPPAPGTLSNEAGAGVAGAQPPGEAPPQPPPPGMP